MITSAIVTIGNEILIGQITDTNSTFIAQQLESLCCKVVEKMAIADDKQAIIDMFERYENKVDVVIITGGLGPTKDDITKQTIAEYFKDQLILNDHVLSHVTHIIENIYQRPITEINRQQAFVPSKSIILFNDLGTAPGLATKKGNTHFINLPGVPFEMENLLTDKVIPYLKQHLQFSNIIHHTIVTFGLGESLLAEKIADWENQLNDLGINLAYLPKLGYVRLRLSAYDKNLSEFNKLIAEKVNELKNIIPDNILDVSENENLTHAISNLLSEKKYTIAIAESCTGGKIIERFTSISGVSAILKGGIVPYATHTKIDILNVDETIIDAKSVVSEEVAGEMAKQVAKKFKANIGIATTGNAGPTKGDSDKPVGTICIAVFIEDKIFTKTLHLKFSREKNNEMATEKLLQLLYYQLKK